MLSPPKQLIKSILARMGLEIRWKTSGFYADPYED
jgi:hypothetical protein